MTLVYKNNYSTSFSVVYLVYLVSLVDISRTRKKLWPLKVFQPRFHAGSHRSFLNILLIPSRRFTKLSTTFFGFFMVYLTLLGHWLAFFSKRPRKYISSRTISQNIVICHSVSEIRIFFPFLIFYIFYCNILHYITYKKLPTSYNAIKRY